MTVELDTAPAADNQQPSTVLHEQHDGQKPSGMRLEEPEAKKPEKPMSVDEAVRKAAADTEAKVKEPEQPKAKTEPKKSEPEAAKPAPERGDGGRFKAKETPESAAENGEQGNEPSQEQSGEEGAEREGGNERPSEGRDHDKPPARFLPRAKEKWGSVDADVRGEVYRMQEEFDRGRAEFEEDRTFRRELRTFEDMAREAGTTVRAALENYTGIDKMLRENPAAGVERILQSIGLTPQQYAQYITGQANAPQPTQADRQTQALQTQVQQLTQQIQQLTAGTQQDRETARLAEVERSIIAPFKADHPRYAELEPDIVFFLNSGKVPSNLSERQRLETAYDMAERINPAPVYGEQRAAQTRTTDDRPLNPAGRKSVRGAPSAGTMPQRNNAKMSIEDAVKTAMSERGV